MIGEIGLLWPASSIVTHVRPLSVCVVPKIPAEARVEREGSW